VVVVVVVTSGAGNRQGDWQLRVLKVERLRTLLFKYSSRLTKKRTRPGRREAGSGSGRAFQPEFIARVQGNLRA
jgi:hypothetical protein